MKKRTREQIKRYTSILVSLALCFAPLSCGMSDAAYMDHDIGTMVVKESPWVDVRSFGAVADSTNGLDGTDSATAIQNAANSLSGIGGRVIIPPTSGLGFRIGSTITLPDNVYLDGYGHNSIILIGNIATGVSIGNSGGVRNIRVGGISSKPISAVGVSNIVISGNLVTGGTRTGTVPMAGIYIDNVVVGWITDNYLSGNGDASAADYSSFGIVAYTVPSYFLHISGNMIRNSTAFYGMMFYNTSNSIVTENYIDQGNTGEGTQSGYGIGFYRIGDAANRADNNTISNNIIRNCAGNGIYVAGGKNYTIDSNKAYDVVQNFSETNLPSGGIAINETTDSVISSNTVLGSDNSCLTISTGSDNVSITGNKVYDCATRGIFLRGAITNASVVGNTVDNVGTNGIEIGTGLNLVITGNVITRATNNGIGGVTDVDNSVISDNRTVGTGSSGVYLPAGSTGNTVTNNNCIGSYDGFVDAGSSNFRSGNRRTTGAMWGTVTLENGSATVSTTEIKTGDTVWLSTNSVGGGGSSNKVLGAVTDNVSFVINAVYDNTDVNTSDNSIVSWWIHH